MWEGNTGESQVLSASLSLADIQLGSEGRKTEDRKKYKQRLAGSGREREKPTRRGNDIGFLKEGKPRKYHLLGVRIARGVFWGCFRLRNHTAISWTAVSGPRPPDLDALERCFLKWSILDCSRSGPSIPIRSQPKSTIIQIELYWLLMSLYYF